MALPEGWEWLDELPEEWAPPAEMREPTRTPSLNLAIKMLSSQILGNDLIELVGMLITEFSRYSMWFASVAKMKVPSNRELAILSLLGHDQARLVYEAWIPYLAAFESSGGLARGYEREWSVLHDTLVKAISRLSETRNKEL